MSSMTVEKQENISNLLAMNEEYAAPSIVARSTAQKDFAGECARARKDPDAFWADYAANFSWSKKWDRVLEWDGVHHRWFTGAKTNITVNALIAMRILIIAIGPLSSGLARMAANASLLTASCTGRSAVLQTA
jgi:Domain of unknown function (DUF3448).